jgi:RNA polymerase sigma factor (sigma-70 family)
MPLDPIIIEGCIKEKRKAQFMLYQHFASPMLSLCMRYCRNRQEAEDVLQEGFIKIFQKISTFRQSGSIEGWVRRIMINQAINTLKAKKLIIIDTDPYTLGNWIPDQGSVDAGEQMYKPEEVMEAIQALPPGYKVVFNLYVFEGYSHKNIAEELEISENTSKSQLSRARNYLRKSLTERKK